MGNCFSRRATATVPSVSPPQPQEKAQSTRPTSVPSSDAAPTVPLTVSTKHGVVRRVRARVQSEHTAFSQRLRDGKDYPLPSSGGDVLTSQHSDRPEKHSHQSPSSGVGSTPRSRSVSMGAHLQGARSHSPGHRTRFTSLHASGQEWRPRFPSSLPSLLPNGFR